MAKTIRWIEKGERTTRKDLIDAALAAVSGDRKKIVKRANKIIDDAIAEGDLAEVAGWITVSGPATAAWMFDGFAVEDDD